MTEPTFGISITRVADDVQPATAADMSVVGIIGTADAADAATFPLNTPVFMYSDDATMLTALGTTGTIADALTLLNNQLADFQVAAKVVVVRVAAGADATATIANIVGDGISTGLSAFLNAGPDLGVIPRLICAPGFTGQTTVDAQSNIVANPVTAALPAILSKLLAHAVVDAPATTSADAKAWRATLASERLIPVYPAVLYSGASGTVTMALSPAVIGAMVRRDYQKGGLPFWSAANQQIYGIVGPSQSINFSLTDGATDGQDLLASNIGILIRGEMGVESAAASSGFVYIGTDNTSTDPLWQFYNVTRGRDYMHLVMLKALRTYLGQFNITGQTVQAIINTISFDLRDLQAQGAILGYRINFPRDLNTADTLRLGKITVQFNAEEAPVLRNIALQSGRYRAALDVLMSDLLAQVGTVTN